MFHAGQRCRRHAKRRLIPWSPVANGFWLEARAGNDIRTLKAEYGDRVTFMGNINADVLARGNLAEIEEEIAGKITVAKQNGGYLYNIDHSVPPTISFPVYSHAIDLIRRYGSYP